MENPKEESESTLVCRDFEITSEKFVRYTNKIVLRNIFEESHNLPVYRVTSASGNYRLDGQCSVRQDAGASYILKSATAFAQTIRKSSTLINHFRIAKQPQTVDVSHQSVISSNNPWGWKILESVLRGFLVRGGEELTCVSRCYIHMFVTMNCISIRTLSINSYTLMKECFFFFFKCHGIREYFEIQCI